VRCFEIVAPEKKQGICHHEPRGTILPATEIAKNGLILIFATAVALASAMQGVSTLSDQLQFEAGEVNFFRWEGNVPNGHLDRSGNRWTFGDVAL
jgi:hypothetical protein